MAFKEKVQEEIAKHLAIGLLAIVAFVLMAIWVLPDAWKPTRLIAWLDEYATGQNLLQLWLVVVGLIAWIAYLRPWLRFDERLGMFRDVRTGFYYCTRCKSGKNILTPLRKTEKGWHCVSCPYFYHDPDYKEPKQRKPKDDGF